MPQDFQPTASSPYPLPSEKPDRTVAGFGAAGHPGSEARSLTRKIFGGRSRPTCLSIEIQ